MSKKPGQPNPTLQWCEDRLCILVQNNDMLDMAMMLVAMETSKDMLEFMRDLVGTEQAKSKEVQAFVEECFRRVQMDKEFTGEAYKKAPLEEVEYMAPQKPPGYEDILSERNDTSTESASPEKVPGKRRNYVNLYGKRGNEMSGILLPGRYVCHCLAQKHALINNCISCGRIVCKQEGEGPCLFCGQLVATPEHITSIQSGSRKGNNLYTRLSNNKPDNYAPLSHYPIDKQVDIIENVEYDKAVQHKLKLLEYDRTNIHRSKVIDDESDYFQNTRWLTKNEKKVVQDREEKRKEEKHASRLQTKITLDFAGRKIVDAATSSQANEIGVIYDKTAEPAQNIVHPYCDIEPQFVEQRETRHIPIVLDPKLLNKSLIRNQDKEFLVIKDEGMCLTMHQPWASLLVYGIKIHEGRSWYSAHRGRLWIHSAAKQPLEPDIEAVQDQYRELRGNDALFPEYYPTSCLLGCVDVDEVLPGSELESEESSSEFIFVCSNPIILAVPLRATGQHKVWRLPRPLLETAKASIASLL